MQYTVYLTLTTKLSEGLSLQIKAISLASLARGLQAFQNTCSHIYLSILHTLTKYLTLYY